VALNEFFSKMLIHQHIKRGSNHPDYCEDFLIFSEKDDYLLAGVFDGCSSGSDSHFASALIGKTIKAEFQKLKPEPKNKPENILKALLLNSFTSLKNLSKTLLLDKDNELLSTVILFLYNLNKNEGIIIVAGDGVISVNGKLMVIDQKNMPDYPAYYLDDISDKQSFEKWYQNHSKQYLIDKLEDVSISTDGILSFIFQEQEKIKPEEYLLNDHFLINNKAMLGRKINILNKKYNLQNFDDLGIIRIVKTDYLAYANE